MQIKQFFISMYDNGKASDEMNKFLRSNKILEVREEFLQSNVGAFWCYSVKYQPIYYGTDAVAGSEEKRDFRKELGETNFIKFSILRQARENEKKPLCPKIIKGALRFSCLQTTTFKKLFFVSLSNSHFHL